MICAAPAYIEKAGAPKTLADLEAHNCLLAGAQDQWRLEGPDGAHDIRVKGNMRSNSAEFVRTALVQGLGIALRATWDIGPELQSGALQIVLPEYHGSSKNAIHAVYPCREFMPSKVNAFIEFFADIFEKDRAWQKPMAAVKALDTGSPAKPVRKPATGKVA